MGLFTVEYAVLDRAGRVQLPREMTEALGMKDRVRLQQDPDHIGVWPDRPGHGTSGATRPAGTNGSPTPASPGQPGDAGNGGRP